MTPITVLLDGNIYNRLENDSATCARIRTLTSQGQLEIVATPIVVAELRNSPFADIPDWFPVKLKREGITISGLARSGMAQSSTGEVYRQHIGDSRSHGRDAIIAQSAHSMGAVFVSDDDRCRKRLKRISQGNRGMTYDEFRDWIANEPL